MTSTRPKTESSRGGRAKASSSTDPGSPPKPDVNFPDWDRLERMLASMKGDICGRIDSQAFDLRTEIASVKQDLENTVEPMLQRLNEHDQTMRELERACTDNSTELSRLDSTVNSLKAQVKLLNDKCEDLEGRSRRNNIHLIGVPEGVEGPRQTNFIAQLLKDILKLDEAPLLDRAHRTLRAKPKDGEAPRPFIIRIHYFHVRNEILRRAGVKRQLHSCPGTKFGLLFPAVLKITLPGGSTHTFDDPDSAMDFVNANIKKSVAPDDVV
ncbi:hypothetical protein D5F01_LYC15435 [Larimichthys crocea]|uniref:Transposase element L1Md-A101/L1Md-A102/L1Md-A2 n=1 Tax=Larimichthys crocea TaxID=215358 RepID=A0A6G0I341_LARCR|nr:hypothetical protein D5F01_LYC15435 [Larimichthys crocea]